MRRTPQKWYNMQTIDMSGNLPMRRRAKNAKVRYSAAYPTGRELLVFGCVKLICWRLGMNQDWVMSFQRGGLYASNRC